MNGPVPPFPPIPYDVTGTPFLLLIENPTGSQVVKKFPAFYGTRRFITAFPSARQLSLS